MFTRLEDFTQYIKVREDMVFNSWTAHGKCEEVF